MRSLVFASLLCACGGAVTSSAPTPVAKQKPAQQVSLADIGLDAANLDRSVDPCQDFYQFACGGWLSRTELPADRAQYGTFNTVYDKNEVLLREILEGAARAPGDDPVLQKIGAFYGACMDEPAIERAGVSALAPLFAITSKVQDQRSLIDALGQLHASGFKMLFSLNPTQDKKDATQMIAQLGQSGLGLPDRDYYGDDDPDKRALRDAYLASLEKLLVLSGRPKAAAIRAAANSLAIESALARAHKTRATLRDEHGTYNRIDREGLQKLAPLPWDVYFQQLGHPDLRAINAVSVQLVEALPRLIASFESAQFRDYLDAQILVEIAPALPKRFLDESFDLAKKLTGQREMRPRWKRCISYVDKNLGELLSQPYVARAFAGDSKQGALQLTQRITHAFAENLRSVTWMDDATRDKARAKLDKLENLIGYPDHFRTYDFEVTRDQFTKTTITAARFEKQYQLARIGKPIDRHAWLMTAPTVDAYYDPQLNQMVFPAGMLQPPFYGAQASLAVNYGAIGMVIGHEVTHGFDDQGAQYDGDGNLSGWWPEHVTQAFDARTQCVADYYSRYEPVPGVHINGKLTTGENIADIGGTKLALAAFRAARSGAAVEQVADGFSEDQQFFLAMAHGWCTKSAPELERMRATVDTHSSPRFRVNGALSNLSELGQAFQCAEGTPMRPTQTCQVW